VELALDGKMEGMSGKRIQRKRRSATPSVSVGAIVRALLSTALLYRKLARAKRAVTASRATASRRGCRGKASKVAVLGRCHRGKTAPVRAIGAMSVGATALGAFAVGALAVGALAIRRLAIKRGAIEQLDIRELKVGRLEVDELLVREETRSQPPTQPEAEGEPPAIA
jgi:hypothetical protein